MKRTIKNSMFTICFMIYCIHGLSQTDLELRINTGGTEVTDQGNTYLADQYHNGGSITSNSNIGLVPPFNTIRYASAYEMEYNIPVLNGNYQVTLYFAETFFGTPNSPSTGVGDRVFDVHIEGTRLIDNLDVFAEAGGYGTMISKTFEVPVTDGALDLYFSSLEADGGVRHAIINAIQVLGQADPSGSSPWTQNGSNIHYNSGNVGIGTANPSTYKLAVNGNIHAKAVKVDLQNWPDYVFGDRYHLPTLDEVETHIKEKGHLINIPSATEVEANGIELGEMNRLLLEKIEELTLYTIEQDKKIRDMEKIINTILEKMDGSDNQLKNSTHED